MVHGMTATMLNDIVPSIKSLLTMIGHVYGEKEYVGMLYNNGVIDILEPISGEVVG